MDIAETQRAPAPGQKVAWWRILSWQMYDFADTIYSMNVYSFYFGLFIVSAFSRNATDFTGALTIANLLVAVTAPLLGAMSDASQRRLPFLRFFAVATAISTALIGTAESYLVALVLFVISYVSYSSAGNFYQALLPGLCNEKNVSVVSGIGVALGYLGSIVGVGAMLFLVKGEADYPLVFPVTAAMFLFFAIPGLTFVPDFAPPARKVRFDIGAAYRRVAETFRNARQYRHLFRFLVADFVYENAVAAVIGLMAIYSKKVVGFSDTDLQLFFIFSTVFAVVFGFLFGPVVDRIGPKRSVLIMLGIWLVAFPAVTFLSTPSGFRFIGPLAGIGLAATWISSRTFLIALTPVSKSGEFFGLYSLSGKSAGVLGQGVSWLVLFLLSDRIGEVMALKAVIWVMILFILGGLAMVLTLPDARPSKANILERGQSAT